MSSTLLKTYWLKGITALQTRPLLFNSITGCVLFSASDALAQHLEARSVGSEKRKVSGDSSMQHHLAQNTIFGTDATTLDVRRFWTAGLLGIFFGGMVYPYAYHRLDKIWPGERWISVVKKSMLEIATVGIFVNSVSMTARGLLVGHSPENVIPHVAQEMPKVTFNDVRVWMPYNLLAFSVIPVYIRPTTTAMMEASWQTYISLRAHASSSARASDTAAAL